MPTIDELKLMTEEERHAAIAASSLTAEQYEQLPQWYRDKARRRAEETIARREAEQAEPARHVS
jgi:low affinity Fe/Cu permease